MNGQFPTDAYGSTYIPIQPAGNPNSIRKLITFQVMNELLIRLIRKHKTGYYWHSRRTDTTVDYLSTDWSKAGSGTQCDRRKDGSGMGRLMAATYR